MLDTAVETLPQRDQDEIEAQETCPICLGELVQYNEDTGEVEHMYTRCSSWIMRDATESKRSVTLVSSDLLGEIRGAIFRQGVL